MLLLALLALLACAAPTPDSGGDSAAATDLGPRGACNPVDGSGCLLPFPSDFLTAEDTGSATGRRVDLDPTGMPVNIDGVTMTPDYFNELDGWSTLGAMMVHLPDASLSGTIPVTDIGAYADTDARTVVIDTSTGERLPHWVERDAFAAGSGRELLLLRPAVPMRHGTTYVVGIRGLVDDAGTPLDPTPGFRALRDGEGSDDRDLLRQVDRYEDVVFPTLEQAGVARQDLQLAWSFTTTSVEGSLGRSLYLRQQALSQAEKRWADNQAAAYTLDSTSTGDCASGATIGLDLTGHFDAPLYRTDEAPGSLLTRGDDGLPYENGTTSVPFLLRVPCSVLTADQPAPLLQFGHGLLGNRSEAYSSSLARLAADNGAVIGAVDWTGMKEDDRKAITLMIIEDPGKFAMIPEGLAQGFVEQQLFTRLVNGPLAADPLLQVGGRSVIDPDTSYLYGISQGAVLGGGLGALSLDFDKVVLGVPGTPFTLLLARSEGFYPFLVMLDALYDDPAEVSVIIGLMQHLWDPGEAAGYARFMNAEPLDEQTPPKPVLLLDGIGDAYVPTLGAHIMARAYGARNILPANRSVWGVDDAEPPFSGSALLEFDFGVDEPVEAVPADAEAGVHWSVTGRDTALELIGHWLQTGEAINPCDGVCDPD